MAKIYQFKGKEVRVDDTDKDIPWFVARDVVDIIGLTNMT
jgi:prophage antirepressor-like protein